MTSQGQSESDENRSVSGWIDADEMKDSDREIGGEGEQQERKRGGKPALIVEDFGSPPMRKLDTQLGVTAAARRRRRRKSG